MKYLIFITLLLVSQFTEAQFSDSLSKALLHAEFSFWQGNNDSVRYNALLKKVDIYRQAGLYRQALNEADRADSYAVTNNEKNQLNYEKMLNSFLNNDYGYCTTFQFDSNEQNKYAKQIELMMLYSINETENWTKCKKEMMSYLDKSDTLKRKQILALPEAYSYKSPGKSKRLSAFLPGLGEIYAGYPLKGITSFILNAGFLAFAGYNFYLGYYVTGCVSGILPMTKFYGGGKRLSVNLADLHNERESNKIKRQYSNMILGILK